MQIKGDFPLVRLPSSLREARRERVQLLLRYAPGYFKKTPRCSTLWHMHTSTPLLLSNTNPTPLHTHTQACIQSDGCREHYPLDLKPPLHLTRPTHPCLLPYYASCSSCCEITHNLLLLLLVVLLKKKKKNSPFLCRTQLKPILQSPNYLCKICGIERYHRHNGSTLLRGWP